MGVSAAQAYTSYIYDSTVRKAGTSHYHWIVDNVGPVSIAEEPIRYSNDPALLGPWVPSVAAGMAWVRGSQELDLRLENGLSHRATVGALGAIDPYQGLVRLEAQQTVFSQFINRPPDTFGYEGYGLGAVGWAGLNGIFEASLSDAAAARFAQDGPRTLRLSIEMSGMTSPGATATLHVEATGREDWSDDSPLQKHHHELSFSGAWAHTVEIDLSLDRLREPYAAWMSCMAWGEGVPGLNCQRLELLLELGASLSVDGGEAGVDMRLGRPLLLDDAGVLAVHHADWGRPGAILAVPVPEPSSALLGAAGLALLAWRSRRRAIQTITPNE